jgi:hypothetical protein
MPENIEHVESEVEKDEGVQPEPETDQEDDGDDNTQPHLPEDRFMSYRKVKKLLAMKHDSTIRLDDPMLMMVTICNVFIGELEKLHERHNDAMTAIITAKTREYVTSVKTTTDAFAATLSEASVEGIRKIFDQHSSAITESKNSARWCAIIVAISALANVIVLALR